MYGYCKMYIYTMKSVMIIGCFTQLQFCLPGMRLSPVQVQRSPRGYYTSSQGDGRRVSALLVARLHDVKR